MTYLNVHPRRNTVSRNHAANSTWTPAVDIIESADDFTLYMDLPGFRKDDLNVTVKEGVLTVSGDRPCQETKDDKLFNYRERCAGHFVRSFKLPENVEPEKLDATYEAGVLSLALPKKEEAKPITVKVK